MNEVDLTRTLRINELFYSLQGESKTVGLPTVFIRLTGCPLRCTYCDTEYAFQGGDQLSIASILEQAASYQTPYICVTGGEPLAQPDCLVLLKALCDEGFEVSLETSGAISLEGVDQRVSVVMDLKTPASGEVHRNLYDNVSFLDSNDQIKFVICDRADYDWARLKLDELNLMERVGEVFFSPGFSQVTPTELADWIIEDRLAVRMQLQLHKILWNDEPGR